MIVSEIKKPRKDLIFEELKKMLDETKQGTEWQQRLTAKVRELVS
jgi:hypothetical protein